MSYPIHRMRRLRKTEGIRSLFQETRLTAADFVLPLFVVEGLKGSVAVESMPGVRRHSLASLAHEAHQAYSLGIPAVLLFGLPKIKDSQAAQAYAKTGIVQKAVRVLKKEIPGLVVITRCLRLRIRFPWSLWLILNGKEVDNDATLGLLQKIALSHAEAGADMVAPSDMMDGRIGGYPQSPGSRTVFH